MDAQGLDRESSLILIQHLQVFSDHLHWRKPSKPQFLVFEEKWTWDTHTSNCDKSLEAQVRAAPRPGTGAAFNPVLKIAKEDWAIFTQYCEDCRT